MVKFVLEGDPFGSAVKGVSNSDKTETRIAWSHLENSPGEG